MNAHIRRRVISLLALPALIGCIAAAGCDIVTSGMGGPEVTAEWRKTYPLDATGRVEILNVNGKIDVEPSSGGGVEVVAVKKARGSSDEAAKASLERITFQEDVSASRVKIETKIARSESSFLNTGNLQVEFHVKVPVGADVQFTTINGGISITGLQGRVTAETTNGGVTARNVSGQLEASTTNGGLDIDMARLADGGVKLDCTNGGIKLRLPRDAKATISASISNGGISAGDLSIDESGEHSRRRLEGKMNGGGARVQIEGVNGGISLSSR